MEHEGRLLDAIDELEGLLGLSSSIDDAAFAEDRMAALQLRRRISEQNAKILALGETALSTVERRTRFRQQANQLRTAISSHLSAWPISSIDLENDEYVTSLGHLRQSYQLFIAGCRDELRRSN